jgi:tetratricopeptide (TPR) repeat protein
MSQFFTPPSMPANPFLLRPAQLGGLYAIFALLLLSGCSTPGQQLANAEIKALNTAPAGATQSAPAPYLGSYGPNDPQRLAGNDAGYDQFNPELSDSVAVPFLSFLIIEPDPVSKNGVPSDIERLVKAKKYPEAIDLINQRLQKTPNNVQLRYVKARMQIELRQWEPAKKTLIEITQQFPELPEPYNNLAALAANQGNWIEARDYLELALKLRPSYTVASANLGEVYIRLAAEAYGNAAKNATLNQRQYSNRAKMLTEILKSSPKATTPTAPGTK